MLTEKTGCVVFCWPCRDGCKQTANVCVSVLTHMGRKSVTEGCHTLEKIQQHSNNSFKHIKALRKPGWEHVCESTWKGRTLTMIRFKLNKNCFQFCPPKHPKVLRYLSSLQKEEKKRKSSNLAKEGRVRENFEAPITSNYHFSLSTWWNDLMPFRG